MEEEEEASHPCLECEVSWDLLLHSDQLMPPLDIGFKRFEENTWKIQIRREERRVVVEQLNAINP